MGTSQQQLEFAVRAVNEASKVLKDISGDIDGLGKSAESNSGKLGKIGGALGDIVKTAAGVATGLAATKLPGFLMDAAKAAAEDEASTARLNKTLENYVTNWSDTEKTGEDQISWLSRLKDHTNEQIKAGQKLAFSDDEVRDSMGFLLNATQDVDDATQRQALAMDLARGANIPLAQATKLLGKLNEENVNTFKKLGIEIPKTATEAQALGIIQQQFGGQAEAYAKSTAGQFAQAQIALDEVKESIGAALIPVMAKLGKALADNLPAIQEFVGDMSEALGPKIEAAVDKVGPILMKIGEHIESDVIPKFQRFGEFWASDIQPKIEEFSSWVQGQWQKFQGYYDADLKPALENVRKGFEEVIDWVREHWEEISAIVQPVMDEVVLIIQTAVDTIKQVLTIIIDLLAGDWDGAWQAAKQIVTDAFDLLTGTLNNFKDLFLAVMAALEEAAKTGMQKLWDAFVLGIANLGDLLVELPGKIVDWLGDLGSILYDAGAKILGGLVDGMRDKLGAVKDFLGDLTSDITDWKGPPDDDAVLLTENGRLIIQGLIDGMEDKVPAVQSLLQGLVQLIQGAASSAAQAVASLGSGAGGGTLAPGWTLGGGGGGMGGSLGSGNWGNSGISSAAPYYGTNPSYQSGSLYPPTTYGPGGFSGSAPWASSGWADGTDFAPAGWAWVGERGPELRKLRSGDQIRSNQRSMAMAGGGRGVTINIQAWDTQDIVRNMPKIRRLLNLQDDRSYGEAL